MRHWGHAIIMEPQGVSDASQVLSAELIEREKRGEEAVCVCVWGGELALHAVREQCCGKLVSFQRGNKQTNAAMNKQIDR